MSHNYQTFSNQSTSPPPTVLPLISPHSRSYVDTSASPLAPLCLVTGGSGFVGGHLIERLLQLKYRVRSIDIVESANNDARVDSIIGDIRVPEVVAAAVNDVTTVFHCASNTDVAAHHTEIFASNVIATANLIEAAVNGGVESLIYTSTSSVVFRGTDIKNGDEDGLRYPSTYLDYYSSTKALAEQIVIKANGRTIKQSRTNSASVLSTCALRPHAIFGPRDTHFISKLIERARVGQITHRIGDGLNLADFTYIDNVVHAHILAMEKLAYQPSNEEQYSPADHDDAEALDDISPDDDTTSVVPASSPSLSSSSTQQSVCAGQCYFITNGEPRNFWAFVDAILYETGCVGPTQSLSFSVAYIIAFILEYVHAFLLLFPVFPVTALVPLVVPPITRHMVCCMSCHCWFSHRKATLQLGYRPIVSIDRGVEMTIRYFESKLSLKRLYWSKRNKLLDSNGQTHRDWVTTSTAVTTTTSVNHQPAIARPLTSHPATSTDPSRLPSAIMSAFDLTQGQREQDNTSSNREGQSSDIKEGF